jgi:Phasin protein
MTTKTSAATSRVERITESAIAPLVDILRLDGSVTQMMARPFEIWLRWHNDLLKAVEPVTVGWLERRRESAGAALEALEKLVRCTDLGEAASIQRDWIDGAVKRLNSDIAALTEQTMALSQEAVAVTRYATQPLAEAQPSSKRRAVDKENRIEAAA